MVEDERTIVAEFKSSLSDLKVNSKPFISMLTILAEDSVVHSEAVVKAIEDHLQEVSNDVKLPVLYLIDSIVKNVPQPYLSLFAKNIVNSFCIVFKQADEKKRMDMWKLRGTWKEVFPAKKLFALDLRVHNMDPAWPIMTYPPPPPTKSAHKHKYRRDTAQSVPAQPAEAVTVPKAASIIAAAPVVVSPAPAVVNKVLPGDVEIQEVIMKKQRELMELQKQKVELELLKVKADLAQQKFEYVQNDFLNTELSSLSDDALDEPVPAIAVPSQISKSLDLQYPAAAASLLKSECSKSGTKKIIPASSIAIAAAKPISRDPRIKISQSSENVAINNVSEVAKQQQLMQQFKIHMASKLKNEQNSLFEDLSKVQNDNKRTKETIIVKKEKDPSPTHRNSSTKEQSKSSSKSRSSSSKSSSSSSSSSSRKVGSKSRSKSSSSSSSPPKIPKLEVENPMSLSEKRSSKRSKSRKTRSPSPIPATTVNVASMNYRIPRRTTVIQEASVVNNKNELIDDDEITVSSDSSGFWTNVNRPSRQKDDSPISFKEIVSNAKTRNYIKKNKDGSRSPEVIEVIEKDVDSSKDEDLRPAVNPALSKDLDLRVLPGSGSKRPSSDVGNTANSKKRKAEKFDALFGNEDVDLRTLTNPKAGRSPTPPKPPATPSSSSSSWAKLKSPFKQERDTKPLRDLNRQNRQRFNKLPLPGKREPKYEQTDDRCSQHNIITIMKQAAEQLADGKITRSQYNTLIQEVMQLNEDQKLKAAQKKEQEIGMSGWEKDDNDENIRINHPPMGPRGPPGGPRWQGPWHHPNQQWGGPGFPPNGPPPGFQPPDGFRPPMGSWQGPRFGGPHMRPEFPHPPPPFGFNPRMGPPPPMMMPNGPMNVPPPNMNPMMAGAMPPNIMTNGPTRSDLNQKPPTHNGNNINNTSSADAAASTVESMSTPAAATAPIKIECAKITQNHSPTIHSGELPLADPQLLQEISKDTMKSINIDNAPREIRYYGNIGVVFMSWDDPRDIGFQDGTRKIFIDGKELIKCSFNEDYKEFIYEGEIHRIKLGTPTRELYVDDKWYECYFGGRPITVDLGNKKVNISLDGPVPQVKIGTVKRTDLVLGKINLIINAKKMVPVFLDAKPQTFEVEGRQCTLEFIDSLQTVLFNGRPFQVVFGGLPRPVIIADKKHYMRFTVLPRGFSAGFVKITGMKGGQPIEKPLDDSSTVPNAVATTNNANQKADSIASSAAVATTSDASNLRVPPGLDLDSVSQDAMDIASGAKSDSQIDMLSSVVPSGMAPSSGLSYQAEPVENSPVATAPSFSPLNLNELFQRLVETGIVPSIVNSEKDKKKKEEEEKIKKPKVIETTFDKPETLKIKNSAAVSQLYTGMQCSSCGTRFAPEMAANYSRHLDWHFRQNRRERDLAKKAHSRNWYYDIADWIQFEEIEDLEDRAQSWFETEKQAAETDGGSNEESVPAADQPSVQTGSDEDAICQVCHETFEQFFNEEKEEWHLRPTVVFEGKNYHPLCLEDHKRALEKPAMVLGEAIAELEKVEQAEEERKAEIKLELTEQDIENQFEEVDMSEVGIDIKTELDSDKEEEMGIVAVEVQQVTKTEVIDEDMDGDEAIQIIEPTPKKIEFEEIDDSSDDEAMTKLPDGAVKQENPDPPRKQSEDKIPDDVPLVFEGVKVKEEPIDIDPEPEVVAKPAAVDTTQVAVKSTIDGNVEFESAAPRRQTAPSKIKLNISKSLNIQKDSNNFKNKNKKKNVSVAAPAKALSEPAAVKPALQGKKMSILPTVEKGHELSGLCSIM